MYIGTKKITKNTINIFMVQKHIFQKLNTYLSQDKRELK